MSAGAPKIYDFAIPAGGSQYIPASGSMYKVLATLGNIEIQEDAGASIGPLGVGQGMRSRSFGALIVRDKSGAANAGRIVIAGTDFINDQLLGSVTINDVRHARAASGIAYGTGLTLAVASGSTGYSQLFNAGGATKSLYLTKLEVSSDVAVTVAFNSLSVAPYTVQTDVFSKSFMAGQPDSANATLTAKTLVGGTMSGYHFRRFALGAGVKDVWQPDTPMCIQPGKGVTVWTLAAGASNVSVNAEWYEA